MRNSDFLKLVLLLLFGCTERVSIEPVYTDDTDWVPTITLADNNYHRVRLEFEQPPRLELERNLVRYIFELKKSGESSYASIDSIELVNKFRGFIPPDHVIPPILEDNANYTIRMMLQYRDEIERTTNAVSFTTPLVKGKVLQRIKLSEGDPDSEYGRPYDFGFGNGYLYVISAFRSLLRIDLPNRNVTLLAQDVQPVEDRFSSSYHVMPVFGDRAVLTEHPQSDTANTYLKILNLNSLEIQKPLEFRNPMEPLRDGA